MGMESTELPMVRYCRATGRTIALTRSLRNQRKNRDDDHPCFMMLWHHNTSIVIRVMDAPLLSEVIHQLHDIEGFSMAEIHLSVFIRGPFYRILFNIKIALELPFRFVSLLASMTTFRVWSVRFSIFMHSIPSLFWRTIYSPFVSFPIKPEEKVSVGETDK